MFGTKKISAKVMNGKLFVRVGGGYLSIDEYIQTYGEKELKKQKMKEMEEMNSVSGFQTSKSSPSKMAVKVARASLNNVVQKNIRQSETLNHAVIDLSLDDKVTFLHQSSLNSSRYSNRIRTSSDNASPFNAKTFQQQSPTKKIEELKAEQIDLE